VIEGGPAAARNASPDHRPQTFPDLLRWFLDPTDWTSTWQRLILLVVPLAAVFGGLGLLAHVVVGTPALWSAAIGLIFGGGTSAITYGVARRRQRHRPELRGLVLMTTTRIHRRGEMLSGGGQPPDNTAAQARRTDRERRHGRRQHDHGMGATVRTDEHSYSGNAECQPCCTCQCAIPDG
jgi:hypothetical protein